MNKKHGKRNTKLWYVWQGMKQRCFNINNTNYKDYGGRGITICDEWKNNFQAFYEWAMANGYADNLTIDRINNNGNYEPTNCRWITNKEQQKNKRLRQTSVFIKYNNDYDTIANIVKKNGLTQKEKSHLYYLASKGIKQ